MRPSCARPHPFSGLARHHIAVAFDLERTAPGGDFPPPCVGDAAATRWMRRVPDRHRLVHSRSNAHVDLTDDPGVAGPGGRAGPERVVLTGTVVGPDGKPAAGAEVVLADVASPLIPNFAQQRRGPAASGRAGDPASRRRRPVPGRAARTGRGPPVCEATARLPLGVRPAGGPGDAADPRRLAAGRHPRPAGARDAGAGRVPRARPGRTAGRRRPGWPRRGSVA